MEVKNYFATDAQGNVLGSAQVYLYLAGTTTLASGLQSISGAALANPFTSQSNGLVQFKAPDNNYDLRVVKPGREFTIPIQCFDGIAFSVSANGDISKLSSDLDNVLSTKNIAAKRSVWAKTALKFPDYNAAQVASGGGASIYPQGHCYDEDSRLYIHYGGTSKNVIAWYDQNLQYGGWFMLPVGGESVAIATYDGGRRIYKKGTSNNLISAKIDPLPDKGSSPEIVDHGLQGVGLELAYANGAWIIEQASVDLGTNGSRTKWNIYDNEFKKTGEFFVAKNIVGWQLPSYPSYPYVPKTQGVALYGGMVVFGLGGSYIPENDGVESNPVAGFGIAACAMDGSLLGYSAANATKLISKLNSMGYYCARTESEGLSVRPDGSLSHIFISVRPGDARASSEGIIIFTEMDYSGEDYSDIAESYFPFNEQRTYRGVYPRGVDGAMYNPLSGEKFTTMQSIFAYISDVQYPKFSWYSSAVSIAPLDGIVIPASSLVTIENSNNSGYTVTITTLFGNKTVYAVNNPVGTENFSVAKEGADLSRIRVFDVDGSGNVTGRITAQHQSQTDADLLMVQQTSTPTGNLLAIGGGSSSFYAASRIWHYVGSSLSTKLGSVVTETFTNGFNPGANLTYSLGIEGKEWSRIVCKDGVFSGPIRPGQYTLSTLPSAAAYNGYEIDVTNAAGGPKRCRSNGSVWQILNTTTTVS